MTGYYVVSPKLNLSNDAVSPMTPTQSSAEKSTLVRYLYGVPSDFSPNFSRPIFNGGGISYGSNRSPLSPMVNLREDVFVMDGVLVNSNSASRSGSGGSGGGGGGKFRLSAVSESSSNSGSSLYKTELCKAWEESGVCRYGLKCQFAHGQEELRPTRNRVQNRSVSEFGQSTPSPASITYKPRSIFSSGTLTTPSSVSTPSSDSPVRPSYTPNVIPKTSQPYWSPDDDDIKVTLLSSTDKPRSRESVDEYVDNFLYGPTQRKRLPVFCDICPA